MTLRENFPAYVFAGGHSERFGCDKSRAVILGQVQLLRLVNVLRDQDCAVQVIADKRQRFEDLGIDCLVDAIPDCGPVAALMVALGNRAATLGAGWALCLGCDQILWRAEWLNQLLEPLREPQNIPVSARPQLEIARSDGSGWQAISFRELLPSGEVLCQPLPGVYHTSLLPTLSQLLVDSNGSRSLRRLLARVNWLGVDTDDNPRLWSFNTPDELADMLARLDGKRNRHGQHGQCESS